MIPLPSCQEGSSPNPGNPADQTEVPSFRFVVLISNGVNLELALALSWTIAISVESEIERTALLVIVSLPVSDWKMSDTQRASSTTCLLVMTTNFRLFLWLQNQIRKRKNFCRAVAPPTYKTKSIASYKSPLMHFDQT